MKLRNITLQQFYKHLNPKISLIAGYIEQPQLKWIIKSCRLKPISLFEPYFKYEPELEYNWFDEWGNILTIDKKIPSIKYDSFKRDIISTDIYRNESIMFFIKRSKLAYIRVRERSITVILLVNDGYLRAWKYSKEKWNPTSPLIEGLEVLNTIHSNLNIKSYKKLDSNEWITTIPVNKFFLPNIDKNEELKTVIKENINNG